MTAEASTTSRELSAANNTGQAGVQLIAPGGIRGTAWIDADRDGSASQVSRPLPAWLTAAAGQQDGTALIRHRNILLTMATLTALPRGGCWAEARQPRSV